MIKAWPRPLLLITLTLGACASDDETPGGEHLALVRGTLASPASARSDHDQGAAANEAHVTELGDLAHVVGLGASILATDPGETVILDRWSQPDEMDGFYRDPQFRAGLDAQLDGASVTPYRRRDTWHGWGDIAEAGGGPRWFVLVQGEIADPDAAQELHDAGAAMAEETASSLGDRAHLPFTGRDDDHLFLALDIWDRPDNIAAFYGDPAFQESAAPLLVAPPTVTVFHSTNWHQWGIANPTATLDGAWQITGLSCDGAAIPVGDFRLDVRGGAGVFVQGFDPGCVASVDETYRYGARFEIAPQSITCDPSDTCDAVLGASCLPTPPATAFDWDLSGDSLTFSRTAEGPGDAPCAIGDAVEFTMERSAI